MISKSSSECKIYIYIRILLCSDNNEFIRYFEKNDNDGIGFDSFQETFIE